MKACIQTLSIMAIAASLSFGQDAPKGPKGEGKRPDPEKVFKKLDTDGNGTVSLKEFKASPRGQKDEAKAEQIFKKIDADSDGELTLKEFKAPRPEHGQRKGGKKKGGAEGTPEAPAGQ